MENIEEAAFGKQEEDLDQICDEWKKALHIVNEARLPYNLPVKWEFTESSHAKIAFNPKTNEVWDLITQAFVKKTTNPVKFITLSGDSYSMPGASTPAAARYERYDELTKHCVNDEQGRNLAPCMAHGDYVHVESLQTDHAQAKSEIIKRQQGLVAKLNDQSDFATFLMEQAGMEKFFINVDGEYYGTLFFYELYFNDIDNLWLICQSCNLHKSDQDTVEWLQKQWLYGKEFIEYLSRETITDGPVLKKIGERQGLAQVIIKWFWDRHASYISIVKELKQKVMTPMQVLNIKVDRVIGEGSVKRAERLQASLGFKAGLLAGIVETSGLGMPKQTDESSHDSSDADERIDEILDDGGKRIPITTALYKKAGEETQKQAPAFIKQLLKENLKEAAKEKKTGHEAVPKKEDKREEDSRPIFQKKVKKQQKKTIKIN